MTTGFVGVQAAGDDFLAGADLPGAMDVFVTGNIAFDVLVLDESCHPILAVSI